MTFDGSDKKELGWMTSRVIQPPGSSRRMRTRAAGTALQARRRPRRLSASALWKLSRLVLRPDVEVALKEPLGERFEALVGNAWAGVPVEVRAVRPEFMHGERAHA